MRVWLPQLSTCIDNLNFQPKSRTFSKKINQKISEALSELVISSFIFPKPRQHSIVFHNVLVICGIYSLFRYRKIINLSNFAFSKTSKLCLREIGAVRFHFDQIYPGSVQSQKSQGFCVADFATLSDERKSRSKIFLLFNMGKRTCVRKFEAPARSKILGISQTRLLAELCWVYTVSVSS